MYKVKKRDGSIVPYDLDKISIAISGAFGDFDEKFNDNRVLKDINETLTSLFFESGKYAPIEEIQDTVEDTLIAHGYWKEAKAYIRYRHKKELLRKANTTDQNIKELLDGESDFWNKENSNKNAKWVTTQRDYIAGITSKDIAERFIFPKNVIEAHKQGIIHIHEKIVA
jgi:ribonucleoside-triphosphate reductase